MEGQKPAAPIKRNALAFGGTVERWNGETMPPADKLGEPRLCDTESLIHLERRRASFVDVSVCSKYLIVEIVSENLFATSSKCSFNQQYLAIHMLEGWCLIKVQGVQ